jgi:hypothetical protein
MTPTVCRPSTFLPALDHTVHKSQQWVTPEMGINSTWVRVPNQAKVSHSTGTQSQVTQSQVTQLQESPSQMPIHTDNLQSLIPHMHVPPQEVCPFSAQQSFSCPTSLPRLQQQVRTGSLRALSLQFGTSGNNSQQFSHLERMQCLTGLTTRLFSLALQAKQCTCICDSNSRILVTVTVGFNDRTVGYNSPMLSLIPSLIE